MKNFKNFLLIFGFISIGCFSQNIHSLNQNLCEGTEAKLYVDSIVNDIFAYQWQISDDSFDWENLISGNIYENVNTDTLIILNLAIDDHNSYFRCIVDSNSFGASVTSDSLIISLNQELNGPLLVDVSDFCIDHAQDVNLVSPYTLSTNNYTWTSSSEEALLFSQEDFSVFVTLNELGAETFYLEIQNSCYTSSDSIVLNAFNDISSLEISSSQSVCSTESFSNLLISTYPDGADSLFNYQWQMSFEGIDWFSISGEVDTILNPNFISTDALFRLLTFSDILCDSVYSNEVSLIKYDPLLSGELSEDQIVCYLTSPTIIDFSVLPSGSVGLNDYTYQWEFSLDLETWEEVENATSISLQAEVLTQTTYYRVRVSSLYDCGIVFTQVLTVTVYDELLSGTVTEIDTICHATLPEFISTLSSPTGGNLSYTYQWFSSEDELQWDVLPGATSSFYQPSELNQTTFYKVDYTSGYGCGTVTSNISEIYVHQEIDPGVISESQVLCYDSLASPISVTQFPIGGGDISYSYQWESSFDNSSWSSIDEAISTEYEPGNLTTSTYYRLEVYSTQADQNSLSCGPKYTESVFIEVYEPLESGALSIDQIICYSTAPDALSFSTSPSGSAGSADYIYQWQESTDLGTWIDVFEATSSTLSPEVLTQTTYYRVRVSSLYDCGIVFTQALTVTVYDEQQTGSIVGADSICQFQSPNNVEVELIAFGGAPFYQYNWQFSDDGGSWNDISNSNFVILPDSILTDTTFFRVEFLNFCDNLISNAIEVIVWPLPIEIDIIGDFQPCLNSFNQVYEVSEFSPLYNYNWGIVNGEITSFDNSHEVEVHWDSINSSSLINVVEINKITGCSKTVEQNINLSYGSAPNKTEILRMDNSNILVCKDSTELINYSWGYVITETNETVYIDNSNQRYVQLDHDFDNIKYDYFVITLYMYDDYSCETISYFDTNDELNVNEYYNQPFVYPNPFSNEFYLVNFQDVISVSLHDLNGRNIPVKLDYNSNKVNVITPIEFGFYILQVVNKDNINSFKLLRK